MTISSTTRKAGPYTGNAATTIFPFAFKVFATSDVLVVQTDASGVETTQALTTNYTVSLNADQNASPGGNVTMLVAPPTSYKLTIGSQVPELQGVNLTNGGSFDATVQDNAFDKAVALVQQHTEKLGRTMVFPISDVSPSTTLPSAASRASQFLAFDASGNPIAASAVTGVVASVFMQTVLDDTTAAAARSTLGALGVTDAQNQVGFYFGTTGTSTAYLVAATGVTSYVDGLTLDIQPHAACGNAPTIAVSGLAAKAIYRELASGGYVALIAGEMAQFHNQRMTYMNTAGGFVLRGSTANRKKMITATRDMTAANGNVSYTGAGFKPTKITAFGSVAAQKPYSIGVASSSQAALQIGGSTDGYNTTADVSLVNVLSTVGGAGQSAAIASMDTDGFTLTWTKAGTPAAGTADLRFFCEE